MEAVTKETKQIRDLLLTRMTEIRVIIDDPYETKEELAYDLERWFDCDPILLNRADVDWSRVNWTHIAIMSGIPYGRLEY